MVSSPDATLVLDCECGTVTAQRLADVDDEHIFQTDEEFTARCPACALHRTVTDWSDIEAPNDADWFKLDLGEGTVPPAEGPNPFAKLRSGTPSPSSSGVATTSASTETAEEVELPDDAACTECNGAIEEDDLQTDGRAPEIGWEYFECPDCGHQMHPDTVHDSAVAA